VSRARSALLACLLALALVCSGGRAEADDDPYLEWWTIKAPHARVNFYQGCRPIAERVADIIESMHATMSAELGWSPDQVTEVVVTDRSDDANGSATALPYNIVRLFVTAPDDMSPLGDHDDWYLGLVTHEYTHILHTDNITGAPAVINAVIGKTLVPNQAQPRWVLEGIAVLNESRHSSAGRLRSSMFDMYLRADVVEDRIVPLDQMSGSIRRWPQGNVWYLYGSRFMSWIADTYGHDVIAGITRDTGAQLLPWGVNRAVRRATGRTYEELYEAWVEHLRRHYGRQLGAVQARGLREGVRLTRDGALASRPRFVPPAARTTGGYAELLYYRNDLGDRSGFYRAVMESPGRLRSGAPELVARVAGSGSASFAPDGGLYFNSGEVWKRVYTFDDLVRLPPRVRAPAGTESSRERLTFGMRAQDPDVSPDGRAVAFTVNHRGTTYLKIAEIRPDGSLGEARTLVDSARWEQAFTPRFSPDGRSIAYGVWTRGGYRDIRIVDVATGRFRQLMRDRAIDQQPSFSPDGRYLLFTSDRTGIANVYAWDLREQRLMQVTNVRTGAYQPELSPDGATLVYVGYGSYGFDLYSMPFDPRALPPAPEYVPDRAEVPPEPPRGRWPVSRYNPLPSLRPRSLDLEYGPGTYGHAVVVRAMGADVVGHHSITGAATFETEETMPYAGVTYGYNRLPFGFTSSVFRSFAPRRGYVLNDVEQSWLERTLGWSNGVSYTMPTAFDAHSVGLSYAVAQFTGNLPVGRGLDPYDQAVSDPPRGLLGVLHGGWTYSNVERYLYSVGPRRGFNLAASMDVGNPYTASQYTLYAFGYNATLYVPMPWPDQHTLALHAAGASAMGDYPKRGLYYVGGFVDTTLLDTLRGTVFQGGYVLRGYKPISFIGSQYHLFNVEYRFPIVTVDRGPSTVPIFLQRLNGNLFLDYGGSFNVLDVENWRDQFHTGVGAELWAELQLGYYLTLNVRLGYARGYGEYAEEGGQKYVVIAAPY
jgi:hypothetical protein